MNTMKILTVTLVLGLCSTVLADTKITYRDSMGRLQGTATTDSYGKTTYRDAQGRLQGTKTTDSYGKTTYRDEVIALVLFICRRKKLTNNIRNYIYFSLGRSQFKSRFTERAAYADVCIRNFHILLVLGKLVRIELL